MTVAFRRVLAVLTLVAGLLASPILATAQGISETDQTALTGPWQGVWTGRGFEYEGEMRLKVGSAGEVDGAIQWVLRASPREAEKKKIGMKGTEYVRGRFIPEFGLLVLEGYRKDDPDVVLGLDKYRLVVSENRGAVGGITLNHGQWDGRFYLHR